MDNAAAPKRSRKPRVPHIAPTTPGFEEEASLPGWIDIDACAIKRVHPCSRARPDEILYQRIGGTWVLWNGSYILLDPTFCPFCGSALFALIPDRK